MAISGLGVAMAAGGAILIYAGLQNENPLQALRSIASGHILPVATTFQPAAAATIGAAAGGALGAIAGLGFPQLVTSAEQHAGDHYSQARRWDAGYSDCSSFVGKAFQGIGITPPGSSTTLDYLAWSQLKGIRGSDLLQGDLVINEAHMVIATSNSTGIGQQNSRRNVVSGAITDLMSGTGGYSYFRYVGPGSQPGAGNTGNPPLTGIAGNGHTVANV